MFLEIALSLNFCQCSITEKIWTAPFGLTNEPSSFHVNCSKPGFDNHLWKGLVNLCKWLRTWTPSGLTSSKQPPPVSNNLELTFWVVTYGRFNCTFCTECNLYSKIITTFNGHANSYLCQAMTSVHSLWFNTPTWVSCGNSQGPSMPLWSSICLRKKKIACG